MFALIKTSVWVFLNVPQKTLSFDISRIGYYKKKCYFSKYIYLVVTYRLSFYVGNIQGVLLPG